MVAKLYSVEQIAQLLNAEFIGEGNRQVSAVAPIDTASATEITFLSDLKYKSSLNTTAAGCVLVSKSITDYQDKTVILLDDPYLGFAKVAQLLDSTPIPPKTIHASAVIGENVTLGANISIGAGCVIEDNVVIEEGVIVGANTTIGCTSRIARNTRIFSNVAIYHDVHIGENCVIQAGAVIGADGFGYANEKGIWVRIPQTGGVKIGDDVDIGANACIDRGALKDTIIGNGVKIDNLCHIAHNVVIGDHSAMAGFTGIAGSSVLGKHVTLSGRSSILGHLSIADGTHVTACSLINRSNKEAGVFSSGTGMQDNKTWRKNVARFRQLDDMAKQLKQLQREFNKLQSESDDE